MPPARAKRTACTFNRIVQSSQLWVQPASETQQASILFQRKKVTESAWVMQGTIFALCEQTVENVLIFHVLELLAVDAGKEDSLSSSVGQSFAAKMWLNSQTAWVSSPAPCSLGRLPSQPCSRFLHL